MNIVDRAFIFAMAAHAVGQKRKYTGEDYFNHPVEVSDIIYNKGYGAKLASYSLSHRQVITHRSFIFEQLTLILL